MAYNYTAVTFHITPRRVCKVVLKSYVLEFFDGPIALSGDCWEQCERSKFWIGTPESGLLLKRLTGSAGEATVTRAVKESIARLDACDK